MSRSDSQYFIETLGFDLILLIAVMSRTCFFCDKGVVAGGHRKHKYGGGWEFRAPRTTRKFKPNLRKIDVEKDGKVKSVDICMKCYKKMRKDLEEKSQKSK